tara:strand:- start:194 stop:1015 length:822 start_codon:yes stop_codon:yes gene_type:complete
MGRDNLKKALFISCFVLASCSTSTPISQKKLSLGQKNITQSKIQTINQNSIKKLNNLEREKNDNLISSNYKSQMGKDWKKKYYFSVGAGSSHLEDYDVYLETNNSKIWKDKYTENGRSIDIAIGRDFGALRFELSFAYENGRFDEYLDYSDNSNTKIDSDRGDLEKKYYFINAYWDIRNNKKWSPYIGGGLGLLNSYQASAPYIPSYNRQSFVHQLKAGLSYNTTNKNTFFIEGFKRDAASHKTNDGLGTIYSYEAKKGFDSSGVQIGFRRYL